jgi:hypothetical protein
VRLAIGAALPVLLAACATTGDRVRTGDPSPAVLSAPTPADGGEEAPTGPREGRAAPGDAGPNAPDPYEELSARLAARAATMLGHRAAFTVDGERFQADCSGFVAWVYQLEGIPLRRLYARAAPNERSAVAAIYFAARAWGVVFGGGGEWPRPGDLVFFRDTYDRNRDGRFDDPFTHVGIVERLGEDGTVTFVHRGARGVARGAMTLSRPSDRRDEDGRELNSILRRGKARVDGSTLAGRLFMGYARFDPARLPSEDVAWQ